MDKVLTRCSPLLLLAACADGAFGPHPSPARLLSNAQPVLEAAISLQFPLRQDDGEPGDPYTWPVNAIFDHSMPLAAFCPDVDDDKKETSVVAFTGELGLGLEKDGDGDPGVKGWKFRRANKAICGKGPVLQGYPSSGGGEFLLGPDGQRGTPDDPVNYTGSTYLSYDGHPGYDYRANFSPVYASAGGTVSVADCKVEIQHANGYSTVYEHLSLISVQPSAVVTVGQPIGVSGDCGAKGNPHLHFGVKVDGIEVDPYGWTGAGSDPYTLATSIVNRRLWATSLIVLSGRFLRGLAYGNGVLYALHSQVGGDGDVIRISKLDAVTGEVLQESPDFNWNGRGVTIGADTLWVADARADVIHRVNPYTLTPINFFGTPGTEPNGLAFDGSGLWLTDPFFQRTYQLSFSGLVGSGTFAIPNAFRTGLEWEQPGMWMTTGETELTHYLPGGVITDTRALQGLPFGTFVYDIALGNGKVYISAADRIYIQDW